MGSIANVEVQFSAFRKTNASQLKGFTKIALKYKINVNCQNTKIKGNIFNHTFLFWTITNMILCSSLLSCSVGEFLDVLYYDVRMI